MSQNNEPMTNGKVNIHECCNDPPRPSWESTHHIDKIFPPRDNMLDFCEDMIRQLPIEAQKELFHRFLKNSKPGCKTVSEFNLN